MTLKSLTVLSVLAVALGAGLAAGEEIDGRLIGVNRATRQVLIEGGVPLTVAEGTKIIINGKPAWFDQLKAGTDISAQVELRDGQYAVSQLTATDPVLASQDSDVQTETAARPVGMPAKVRVIAAAREGK